MEIQILKPFGPTVLKVKIPKKIVDDLNDYVDKIILDNEQKKQLDHGKKLVGDVTQEFKLEYEFVKKCGWLEFLAKCAHDWIKIESNQKITKFNLLDSWIVRQFKNEYNPIHWHGGHLSGAGFLKVPNTFGNYVQEKGDKDYYGGTLNLIHGNKQFMSNSKYTIRPEVGDFYFFPHYLMHTVYPFKGTEDERRSISFNAIIDQNIYDVYSGQK